MGMGGNGWACGGTLQSTQPGPDWMSAVRIHCRRTAAPQGAATQVLVQKKPGRQARAGYFLKTTASSCMALMAAAVLSACAFVA